MTTYLLLTSGVWMVLITLIMSTNNFWSFLMFRAPPAILGILSLFQAVSNLGWLG